jgi:hypothetical protein
MPIYNPTLERMLEEGNWSAAIALYGIPVERQRAGRLGLDPKRFKVMRRKGDGWQGDYPVFFLLNDNLEASIMVMLSGTASPNSATVTLYEQSYNPTRCQMNPEECTCDTLSDAERDDGMECPTCEQGSDFCNFHGRYH